MQLDDYLRTRSISRADFAEKIGLSEASISRNISGKQGVTFATANRIIRATGGKVSLAELYAAWREFNGV